MATGRRTFLKTVAMAGGMAAAEATKGAVAEDHGEYPRVFAGARLRMIAFPMGGVGAGTIGLGGRGQLRDWEIFNRPEKGRRPKYCFASIWAKAAGSEAVARVLEARLSPPYEGAEGLGSDNAPGLPRLQGARFAGEYPMAHINFEDNALPVAVSLEAFTPFAPLDADASGLPVTILRYSVRNPGARPVSVGIAFSLDNPIGAQGRECELREAGAWNGLYFHNPKLEKLDAQNGSFAVAALSAGSKVTRQRGWGGGGKWHNGAMLFWDEFSANGELGPEAKDPDTVGSVGMKRDIAPGATATFTYLLAWHIPNRSPGHMGWAAPKGEEFTIIGNHYCTRFADAWDVARYAAGALPELERRTRRFVAAMRATTLPAVVRDAATSNLSTLARQTSFRAADGKLRGFEGCFDSGGAGFGSCTHVWNYESATAHVFPSLSRSMRETSFDVSTDANGLMSFREMLPAGKARWGNAAADGQMGQLMHLYLDWRQSGDTAWLRARWPQAKKAMEFAWIPGGWDANRDGVMEGAQHNTYDVEFYGPNPLCGFWYLGALRACEEMARAVGDASANEYRRLFDSGSKWIDFHLFNGEFYVQKVQPGEKSRVAAGLMIGMGASDPEHPDFQLGEGCLVDQLAGQYFADVCGLGLLAEAKFVRKALESIYRYNYKRDLSRHANVQRTYALNDEAALVICDYGKAPRPRIPFPYYAEVMTGFEYTAAVLMLHHGMVKEGIEVIGNIRRRYDGERRNPWDEAEYGHHYARAMASWSAIPALSGFRYHGVEHAVEAMPKTRGLTFTSFWSTGTAWGTFTLTKARFSLDVIEGELVCKSIVTPLNPVVVKLNGVELPHKFGGKVVLSEAATIGAGRSLTISAGSA